MHKGSKLTLPCQQLMHQLVQLIGASKHMQPLHHQGKPTACASPMNCSEIVKTR